jgi:acyl transferase domain-containing protein
VKSSLDNESTNVAFLEVGPHSALAGPLRQIFKVIPGKKDLSYLSALIRSKDCTESFLKMVGQLYLQTVHIKFDFLTPSGKVLTDLPRYQWRHETSFWHESRITKEWYVKQWLI